MLELHDHNNSIGPRDAFFKFERSIARSCSFMPGARTQALWLAAQHGKTPSERHAAYRSRSRCDVLFQFMEYCIFADSSFSSSVSLQVILTTLTSQPRQHALHNQKNDFARPAYVVSNILFQPVHSRKRDETPSDRSQAARIIPVMGPCHISSPIRKYASNAV